MRNIKKLKLKIMSIIMLVALLSLEFSPFAVKGAANQLQFYSPGAVSVGYDSYNGKNVWYSNATLGGTTAYCIDYTCGSPSGTMSFRSYLSDQGLAILIHGYPNCSAASLGCQSNEEAYMATQMALWEVMNRTGESLKAGKIFRVENVTPVTGKEGFYNRSVAAAKKLVAIAAANPYTSSPLMTIDTTRVTDRYEGTQAIFGPYTATVSGLADAGCLKGMSVSLTNAPASAYVADANGNRVSSISNGQEVYVRMNTIEDSKTFKVNFNADVDRKVGCIYTTGGYVQDYVIIDSEPENINRSVEIEWKKSSTIGEIKLIKVDQDNEPVVGAKFVLKDANGKAIIEDTTGGDGVLKFLGVPEGNYILEEISAPAGYAIKEKSKNVTVVRNKTAEVKFVNERISGKLVITKIDDLNRPLKDVTFDIYNEDGKYITSATTDENGKASVVVDYGKYFFKEVSAPAGYIMDDTVYSFSVTNENRTFYQTVTNDTYKGKLVIVKKDDSKEAKPIAGVKFAITQEDGTLVKEITTNADGLCGLSNLPFGKYFYQETYVPEGYVMDTNKYDFAIETDGQVIIKEVINKKITGKLEITKVNSKNEPIANVKFNLLDANKNVIDTLVTGADGKVSSKELEVGTYYYQEVSAPAKYKLDTTIQKFEITNKVTLVAKKVVNYEMSGKLHITKYTDKGTTLANVKFEITDAQGNVVDTITTNAQGIAESKSLEVGTYYYQEIEAPDYVVKDTEKHEFVLNQDNQVVSKSVINDTIEGKLKIIKIDESKHPIEGVKFEIYNADKVLVDTITTNKDGIAESKDLEKGSYFYKEVYAPEGFVLDGKMHEFAIHYNNQVVIKNVINYHAKGNLQIVKYTDKGTTLANVKFEISDANGFVVDTIITDKDGKAESKDLPLGTYYYQEVEAPDNVVIDTAKYAFKLNENNQVVTKTVYNNTVEGKLKIIKVDENNKPLAGVEFKIYDLNKNVIDTIVTNAQGIAESGELEKGTYYYQETKAPAGIIFSDELVEFTIEYDGQNVIKNVVNYYEKEERLKIIKIDENSQPIEGVKFNIYDSNKKLIDTIVTDENGLAVSKDLYKGTFYYQEIEAPEGLVFSKELVEFTVEYDGQNVFKEVVNYFEKIESLTIIKVDENNEPLAGVKFNIYDSNKKLIDTMVTGEDGVAKSNVDLNKGTFYYQEIEAPEGIVFSKELVEFTVEYDGQNVIKNVVNYYEKEEKLRIIKVDENNEPLAGVKFNIYDSNKKLIDTMVTNEKGIANSNVDLNKGTFYYQEVEAPEGIVVDNNYYKFTIEYDGQNVVENMVNYYAKGKLEVHKIDSKNNPIEGVIFEITDEKGNKVDRIDTSKDGYAETKKLPLGTYYYQEIDAPTYVIMDTTKHEFVLDKNDVVVKVTVENKVIEGKLKIIKVDENNVPLQGVKFEILDLEKNLVDTIVTDKDGVARSKDIEKGTYYYHEIEAPEGIVVDDNYYEFTIEYDGQNVIGEMVNYYAKGQLQITKYDSKNNTLANVKFEICNAKGEVVDTIVTDKDGVALTKKLPLGTYTYKEVSAPENVVMDEEAHEFVINENNQVVTKTVINKLVEGKLHIIKKDENHEPLQGVEFDIIALDGTIVDHIVTDENGEAVSKDIEKGTYYYQETKAPEGIIIDTEKHEFTIEYDGQNVIGKLINYYAKGELQITKLVEGKNTPLANVEFTIYDKDRKAVETIVTDENGYACSSKLVVGTYYFKETKAPQGYIMDNNEHKFELSENGDIAQAVVYNKEEELPKTGGLLSTDMEVVLMVSLVAMFAYVMYSALKKREEV